MLLMGGCRPADLRNNFTPVTESLMTVQPTITSVKLRILALGDSYTIGESVDPGERWPIQLAERLRGRGLAVNDPGIIARTGWTTGELSEVMQASALVQQPGGDYDLVTLLIGVNNQYRGLPVDEYQVEFRALLDQAVQLAGSRPERVVVVSIPDWGVTPFAVGRDRAMIASAIDALNAANQAESARAGARYIDITPISRQAAQQPDLLATDGLHPSGKMYAAWVDLIEPAALEILGSPLK
jgi:lysophospholipase L1-like esterase